MSVVETVQALPLEAQKKVLEYTRALRQRQAESQKTHKPKKLSEHSAIGM